MGAFLPNEPVNNDEIEDLLGLVKGRYSEVKEWVLDYNGIETRYYALDPNTRQQTHSNAELTASAVHAMCNAAGFDLADLECMACGTSSPDQMVPSHGAMVHGVLACHPYEMASTAGVCCSGMSSLKYAWMSILSGLHNNAACTGSELASVSLKGSHFDPEIELKREAVEEEPMLAFENAFLRWMLSDGAGALLLQNKPSDNNMSLRIDWVDLVSYANQAETCMYMGGKKLADGTLHSYRGIDDPRELIAGGYLSLAQDVRVLRSVLLDLTWEAFQTSRAKHALKPDEIDWILPHYSSEGFRQPLMEGLANGDFPVPEDRWFTNLKWKGNTGAASIYIMLEELVASGRASRGDRILCFIPESARFTFSYMHLTVV